MKNLELISFVGVDTQTNLDEIMAWRSHIPCEFSVLFSDSKSVGSYTRYPSYKFCKDFLDMDPTQRIHSLHLCGSVIDRYLKQEDDIMELCHNAMRIQLNLNIAKYSDYEKLSDDILAVTTKYTHRIILQQNKTKAKFMECFLSKPGPKVSLLQDSSGGFGREITQVNPPHEHHVSGYAGGIKPENVVRIVDLIEKNNPNNRPYYIDMESGVRTDNIFSLEKCRQVIDNLK